MDDLKWINRAALRQAYEKAVTAGAIEFEYRGMTFVTIYAKYLLEFLEGPAKA